MKNVMDLELLISRYKVFVDTCTLMHDPSDDFFKILLENLRAAKKKIWIPKKVVDEINKHAHSSDAKKRAAAINACNIVSAYQQKSCVEIRASENDPFADSVFLYVFQKFRTRYDLALITQDRSLCEDMLHLNHLKSVRSSKNLLLLKLDGNGNLVEWEDNNLLATPDKTAAKQNNDALPINHNSSVPSEVDNKVDSIPDIFPEQKIQVEANIQKHMDVKSQIKQAIGVEKCPELGDDIITSNGDTQKLAELLGSGGEGRIYLTNEGFACKVYHPGKLTKERMLKLELMISEQINIPGVCWPQHIACNSNNQFVGYIMNAAKGKSMQRCMFVKQRLMQNFPTWNRYNLVKLAITWLEKVTKLHQRDILIGDINPNNFLIVSDTEVYFVDTDSYQIKDYVCPVGMANFTAPEIQNSDFTSFYRTPQHEYFAIATLLFMILLPGKPPFSHQGGGDPRENIRERAFPYPLGEISGQAAPPGPWRFIWSHLPFKTKEAFYNCFTKDIRISADEWLELMRSYKHALEVGYLSSSGGSHDLFPAVFKELSEHAKIKYGKTEKSGSANNYPEIGMNFRTSRNSQPGNPRGNKKQKHGPLSVFQIYSDLYNFKSNNSTEGD